MSDDDDDSDVSSSEHTSDTSEEEEEDDEKEKEEVAVRMPRENSKWYVPGEHDIASTDRRPRRPRGARRNLFYESDRNPFDHGLADFLSARELHLISQTAHAMRRDSVDRPQLRCGRATRGGVLCVPGVLYQQQAFSASCKWFCEINQVSVITSILNLLDGDIELVYVRKDQLAKARAEAISAEKSQRTPIRTLKDMLVESKRRETYHVPKVRLTGHVLPTAQITFLDANGTHATRESKKRRRRSRRQHKSHARTVPTNNARRWHRFSATCSAWRRHRASGANSCFGKSCAVPRRKTRNSGTPCASNFPTTSSITKKTQADGQSLEVEDSFTPRRVS